MHLYDAYGHGLQVASTIQMGEDTLLLEARFDTSDVYTARQVQIKLFAAIYGMVVLLGVLSVLFPLLSRFENSTAMLLKNTVLLAAANLPRTLGLGLLNAVSAFLCVRYVFPVFFLPALAALIGTLLIEPMFKPFLPEDAA